MMPTVPVPVDIPLAQPAPMLLLKVLVVAAFLMHILFVLLMVGGSLVTLALEAAGLGRPDLDKLARLVGRTITVNKSMAVVLGVAPLLVLNTLYTVHFYAANALTGSAWILVVPLVALAFLLSYAHEYSWEALADRKGLHLSLMAAAAAIFLCVPLIFLANINLMLYPEWWGRVHGFLSSLLLPNVLPRYFHFLAASLSVTALFLAWWFGRAAFRPEEHFVDLDRMGLRRLFLTLAFGATAAQLFFGPLLYLTLPAHAVGWSVTFVILLGAAAGITAIVWLWKASSSPEVHGRRLYWPVVGALAVTVVFMGTGRHLVRETALASHQARVAAATARYLKDLSEARNFVLVPGGLGGAQVPPGEAVFGRVCAACHAGEKRLVGPPIKDIQAVYRGNPAGIVAWAKAPGRKRLDYPAMPPQALPDDQLTAVADFLLTPAALTK